MAKYELVLTGGILAAKSSQELIKKIEAEADFWSFLNSVSQQSFFPAGHYPPQWVNEAINYVKQLAIFWSNHLEMAKAVTRDGDEAFLNLKSTVERSEWAPPYSGSRVATLAKRLAEKNKLQESIALLSGASGKQFAQIGVSGNQVMDQSAYISFGRSLAAVVELDLESAGNIGAYTRAANDAKVIESLSNDMGLLVADASSTRDAFFGKTDRNSKAIFSKLKRLRETEIKYFRDARREERERRETHTREFHALMEAFNAHLRLKRPVELWQERGLEHEKASDHAWKKFFYGAVVLGVAAAIVAFGLGGMIADSFIVPGCDSGNEPQCNRISARGPLNISLLLVATTTWLWYLRLQMRIFLSERHLALDARERMAFAETYLSLLKGAEVSRDHETVVLQSLMRPTQDGIIKDESGPDFALSSLLAKALERK